MKPGRILDVGCGIGRNLSHLNGNGVGIDYNSASVDVCRRRGLLAYEPDAFLASKDAKPGSFDSMLLAHVAEHMTVAACIAVIESYAPYVVEGGKLILITPQEVGHASDATHVTFMDFAAHKVIFGQTSFTFERSYSFPFPRLVGKVFIYNEFVSVGTKSPRFASARLA